MEIPPFIPAPNIECPAVFNKSYFSTNDHVCEGPRGPQGFPGQDGQDGDPGVNVSGAQLVDDILTINLDNGTSVDVGNVRGPTGPKGDTGPQGYSVTNAQVVDDNLIITREGANGPVEINAGNVRGLPGTDGVGVSSVSLTDGVLSYTLSNTNSQTLGNVIGPPGDDAVCEDGQNGADGFNVTNAQVTGDNLIITREGANGPVEIDAGNVRGPAGDDGVGVSSVFLQDGNLNFTLSNNTTQTLGNVIGPSGTNGNDGATLSTLVLEGQTAITTNFAPLIYNIPTVDFEVAINASLQQPTLTGNEFQPNVFNWGQRLYDNYDSIDFHFELPPIKYVQNNDFALQEVSNINNNILFKITVEPNFDTTTTFVNSMNTALQNYFDGINFYVLDINDNSKRYFIEFVEDNGTVKLNCWPLPGKDWNLTFSYYMPAGGFLFTNAVKEATYPGVEEPPFGFISFIPEFNDLVCGVTLFKGSGTLDNLYPYSRENPVQNINSWPDSTVNETLTTGGTGDRYPFQGEPAFLTLTKFPFGNDLYKYNNSYPRKIVLDLILETVSSIPDGKVGYIIFTANNSKMFADVSIASNTVLPINITNIVSPVPIDGSAEFKIEMAIYAALGNSNVRFQTANISVYRFDI